MSKQINKILSLLLCLCLVFEQAGFAQSMGQLDISGYLTSLRNNIVQDKFRPLHLRYLAYDTINNDFSLLVDKGNDLAIEKAKLEDSTKSLMDYFFVGLSLPNESFWVNLRPDAETNIIDDELAKTDIGRIMLEADVQLKKDTARYTSPNTAEGKEYWDKLYKKAGEIFGYDNIEIPTLTRPWIAPDEILVGETKDGAYVFKATLKVLLEQDYLKDSAVYNFNDERLKALNEYSSQLIRELIIPKITQEVNTSKRYASLRQVYYSLILAQWFKQRFPDRWGYYSQLIDRKNLAGLTSKLPWSKTTYFKEYQKSFKNGEYNLNESVYTPFGQTIRSYFSGGIKLAASSSPSNAFPADTIPSGPNLSSLKYDSNSGKIKASDDIPKGSSPINGETWLVSSERRPVGTITDSDKDWVKLGKTYSELSSLPPGTKVEEYVLNLESLPPGTLVYLGDTGQSINADGVEGLAEPIEYVIRIERDKSITLWFSGWYECYVGSAKLLGYIEGFKEGRRFIPGTIKTGKDYNVFPYFWFEQGKGLVPHPQGRTWHQDFPCFRVLYPKEISKIATKAEVSSLATMGTTGNGEIMERQSLTVLSLEELQKLLWIFHDEETLTQLQRDPFMRLRKGIYPEKAVMGPDINPRVRYAAFVEQANARYGMRLPNFDVMRTIFIDILGMDYLQDTKNLRATVGYRLERLLARINQIFDKNENIPAGLNYSHIERVLTELDVDELYRLHAIAYSDVMQGIEESARQAFPIPEQFDSVIQFLRTYGRPRGQRPQPGSLDDQFLEYINTLRDYINRVQNGFERLAKVSQHSQGKGDSEPPISPATKLITSSPLTQAGKPGGIDFRNLPILTQALNNLSAGSSNIPLSRLNGLNLNLEWQEIEQLVQSGIAPSGERMKEYLQASCYKEKVIEDKKKMIICISNILRQQEESYISTEPVLRDILVVLESGRSIEELRMIFIGVKP